ncbi:hypothetical protein JZ751_025934 [Albula glossodonta]|uniref:SOCS box domain-containing protein n=1 Tax=Albula glossodonta TaxID=121402 RepID=A0A8T2NDD3_9TELE|nr:hypothetical protein JZ751_025934 [Albula glossodonta]
MRRGGMDFSECYQHTCSAVGLAAREGKTRLMRKLIQKGYSTDVSDNRGWNPLHEAAFHGSCECVRILIKTARSGGRHREYINAPAHDSATPLFLAAQQGHARVARALLHAGADANRVTDDDAGPLFAAVDGGHAEVVKLLVSNGAEVNRPQSVSGWTCLHQAVFKGHAEIVKFLVGVADVNATDDFGIPPIFVAAQYGQQQCVEILASAGANVSCQSHDLATPLLIASQEGHLTCVEALLDHGADPNLFCNEDKWQLPVHAAAEFGHVRVLERLLPLTGRECDRGRGKVSPVYSAVLRGQAGAHADCGLYPSCLEQDLPYLLELLLGRGGLPEGDHLTELVRTGLDHLHTAARHDNVGMTTSCFVSLSFCPFLFLSSPPPSLPVYPSLPPSLPSFEKAESSVLSYFLEFTNWRMLPQSLQHILCRRRAESTWIPLQQFDSVPSLCQLCRLALRDMLGSEALAQRGFVQRLPLPPLLHDFLLFTSCPLPTQPAPEQREYLGHSLDQLE